MAPQTTNLVIASFGPKQWSGHASKGAGKLFIGSGFLMFLLCLVLMIFIEPLRNPGAVIIVCTLAAIIATVSDITSTARREKRFLTELTETINEFVLETTGDRASRITSSRFRTLIEFGGKLPLTINGVPGLDLTVGGKRFEERQVIATVHAPDYGLDSFDLLLAAEEKRKP